MRTLTVLCSGAAIETPEDPNHPYLADFKDRVLTPEAEATASAQRDSLGDPTFDLVMASHAICARQTASIVARRDIEKIACLDALTCEKAVAGSQAKQWNELFERIGIAPLERYFAQPGGTQIIAHYATKQWGAVSDLMRRLDRTYALAVVHPMHAYMMVYASLGNEEERDRLITTNPREFRSFILRFDGTEPDHVHTIH